MPIRTARNAPAANRPNLTGTATEQSRQRIQWLQGEKNLDAVRDEAVALAAQLEQDRLHVEKLSAVQQVLREKLEAVTAHEHYAVVITGVERNGCVVAEVAGLGNGRVQVAVHPEVDPKTLVIGATGLVTSGRNCLLKVTGATGLWKDVARFERYLDSPDRILLKCEHGMLAVDVAERLRGTPLKKGDLIGYDREVAGLAYERIAEPKGEHLFDENVTDDFAQLGGLDSQVACIKQHIDFRIRHRQLAAKYCLKSKCGILLHGLPGNGKTRIARCCAGYIRRVFPGQPCRFMHIAASSDYSMFLGVSEENIIGRFHAVREAAAEAPVVMVWDEIDAIARRRGTDYGSGAPDRILDTLLSQIDGVAPLSNVILLYATNRPDMVDPALLRPGRTDEKLEIPPPGRRAAEAILRGYLGRGLPLAAAHSTDALIAPQLSRLFAPNGQFAEVAQVKLSDGRLLPVAGRQLLSGAMLENAVHTAAQQAAAREAETGQQGLTEQDLAAALEAEMVSAVSLLSPGNIKSYVKSIPQDGQPLAVEAVLKSATVSVLRPR